MRFTKTILALTFLIPITPVAREANVTRTRDQEHAAEVTQLFSKVLTDLPGKEGVMITVTYPPGASDPIHRHNADAFVYVLEGSIVMQVRGGKRMTLTPGQTFYEGPNDIHVIGRNASETKPAKFLVVMIKKIGAPILVPAK